MDNNTFNISDFFKHANEQMQSSGGSLGTFCAAKISVGYLAMIKNATEFFPVDPADPLAAYAKAKAHAVANGGREFQAKPACQILLQEGTDVVKTEYPVRERAINIAAMQELNPATEQYDKDSFGWTVWLERSVNVENGFDAANSGKIHWIQLKNAVHPDYDPTALDAINSGQAQPDRRLHREVWRDGMATGDYGPQFYPYAAAVFMTREELEEHALALGAELASGSGSVSEAVKGLDIPVPDGWTPGEEIWKESVQHFAAAFNDDNFSGPLPLVKPKLEAFWTDWKDTGLTLDDLINVWKAVRS
jgi:hypothetical protein